MRTTHKRWSGIGGRAWRLALLVGAGWAAALGTAHGGARAQTITEFVPTFSSQPRVKQQLEGMQRLAAQKRWDEWLAGYQQLVDDPRDPVMPRDNEILVGVRFHCHQLLAGLPPAARQRYRTLYDAEAKRLYDRAASGEPQAVGSGMRDVYSRYRFSSYGDRALLWIANHALDEGRSELARVAYSRLVRDSAVAPTTLLRWALAADAAGRRAEARAALERVRKEFAAHPVQLAGQPLTGAQAAEKIARGFRPETVPGADQGWPSFAGRGDRRMTGAHAGAAKLLWEFTQPTDTEIYRSASTSLSYTSGSSTSMRQRFRFLTFPAVAGDRLYVQGARNLTALNLLTGKAVWDRQDFVLGREEAPPDNSEARTGGIYYRSGRAVQAAPSVDGRLLVGRFPLALGERDAPRWPEDFAVSAFDARSGSPIWRRIAAGEPRGIYFNVPALDGHTVFTGIATHRGGLTEYTAVALDAGSGEPLWTTYLGGGSDPLGQADGSPPAVRDGLVWFESSLYTVNALDLVTGEIRMVYRYQPGPRTTYRGGVDSSPVISNEPISLIATAPGPVVFAPRWGTEVVALDPAAGKLLWTSPKGPNRTPIGSLFGADERHAYVCGDHVQAIRLVDGSPAWTWEPKETDHNVGYAAVAGDRVYIPVDGRIDVRSGVDGKLIESIDLTASLGKAAAFASLLVLPDRLLIATRDRVLCFGAK